MTKKENRQEKIKKSKIVQFFNNPWKTAFILLVAVLVGFSLVLINRITTPRMSYDKSAPKIETKSKPILDINMKKAQVNESLNFFMKDMMEESGVDYSFNLENDALIDGTFKLLGHETHFYLYFDPFVLSDGNVQLRAKSLSVGSLNVPIPAMINYISSTTDLPDWIEIDADAQIINLHLDKFKMKNGLAIKAKKINLIDDDISFSLYLPKDAGKDKKKSDTKDSTKETSTEKSKEK
ncbi:YpmS family protein [Vagococcus hydrophili]|uniref:YpmS family protein n=1 Tax=Vagococcus hydrophili TaxID=2714947 RepID=A0A6G8AWL2_9ENTE|nr:YpmS family protein [Vagococcus hydrophili]QIL49283.1 YpmS family protein [Vagococcus hydrophili]